MNCPGNELFKCRKELNDIQLNCTKCMNIGKNEMIYKYTVQERRN